MRPFLALTVLASALAASSASNASAADIRLGLNTSAALGCQIVGLRAGVQSEKISVYGQVSYCNAQNATGASFGGGVSYDVAQFSNFKLYLLGGIDTLPSGSLAANLGVGTRYSTPLLPVEGYIEAGAQLIRGTLANVPGPRLSLGVNYRLSVENLQGTLVPDPKQESTSVQYAGAAPVDCKLTQEQDVASARGTASSAASAGLSDAAGGFGAVYGNINYTVSVGGVSISGNSAKVSGSVKISATQRSNGENVGGTFGGTINLTRDGCGWRATGYTQSGS
ncbi:hypothetical protein EHF33_06810 [Deinococcus psychrotolerans]|uniref:Porin n=1 Tax=Deinococcus psychrotolerans TaxID=2489213 RepID=A0A3G8YMX4_9DEIO|nr:hypothetical protein [Deinococcus psychrotolerans]AZI42496.1 hypothetical protein EHF33_06810 [Deinococcus psychrotolerans]